MLVREKAALFDVGSDTGEYLRLALSKVKDLRGVPAILLETDPDLARKLRNARRLFSQAIFMDIIGDAFENFTTVTLFDIILAFHMPLVKDSIAGLPQRFISGYSSSSNPMAT